LTRDERSAKGEWRFLLLTLFVCAWMLVSPHMRDRWIVQVLLQLFLLNSVAVTLWANPQWRRIRWAMIAFWVASLVGSLLAVAPLPSGWLRIAHTAELASLLPVLALVSVGMLRYVFRGNRLTVDGLFATVAVYLFIETDLRAGLIC
jgi:hypothetical protein